MNAADLARLREDEREFYDELVSGETQGYWKSLSVQEALLAEGLVEPRHWLFSLASPSPGAWWRRRERSTPN